MAMEEVSSIMTIAVFMVQLSCHEDVYLQKAYIRKTKSVQLSKKILFGLSRRWLMVLLNEHRPLL